jgi:hypothetical protein
MYSLQRFTYFNNETKLKLDYLLLRVWLFGATGKWRLQHTETVAVAVPVTIAVAAVVVILNIITTIIR